MAKVKNYYLNVTEIRDSDFKNAFPGIFNFTVGILEYRKLTFFESLVNEFSEVCSTWKDGCIAFSSEHIQISKYYLDGPDSKPYQKCKVINLMHFRYFLSDSHLILSFSVVMLIV